MIDSLLARLLSNPGSSLLLLFEIYHLILMIFIAFIREWDDKECYCMWVCNCILSYPIFPIGRNFCFDSVSMKLESSPGAFRCLTFKLGLLPATLTPQAPAAQTAAPRAATPGSAPSLCTGWGGGPWAVVEFLESIPSAEQRVIIYPHSELTLSHVNISH